MGQCKQRIVFAKGLFIIIVPYLSLLLSQAWQVMF